MNKNLRGIDLNLLTVFDAIMTEEKLSKAGDRLGMTQPAVSAALARLRVTFNDELFLRSRQGMVPTPKANELIKPIRDALGIIRETLEASEDFDPQTSERTFRITMSDFGELTLMPHLLAKVAEQSQFITIQSQPELGKINYEQLKQGQLDLHFDYLQPKDNQLDSIPIAEDVVVVIARRNHPRLSKTISMDEFLAERHIILNYRDKKKTILEQLLEGQKLSRRVLAEATQYTAVPEMVVRTDAIAVLPKRMALYYQSLLPLEVMPSPLPLATLHAYMVWNKALNRDQGHQWLRNLIFSLQEQL